VVVSDGDGFGIQLCPGTAPERGLRGDGSSHNHAHHLGAAKQDADTRVFRERVCVTSVATIARDSFPICSVPKRARRFNSNATRIAGHGDREQI